MKPPKFQEPTRGMPVFIFNFELLIVSGTILTFQVRGYIIWSYTSNTSNIGRLGVIEQLCGELATESVSWIINLGSFTYYGTLINFLTHPDICKMESRIVMAFCRAEMNIK